MGGRSRESGGEREMAPSAFSLSLFSPSSPSLFSPVTRPAKRVSMKTKVNSLSRTTSRPALTVESRGNVTSVKAQPIHKGHTSL